MKSYDADRDPDATAWLELAEDEKIALVEAYHRRHHPRLARLHLHATMHTVVENQLAEGLPVTVDALQRLRREGLTRHDAIHAIASVVAARIYDLLREQPADPGADPNEAYAKELRQLTAARWRNS